MALLRKVKTEGKKFPELGTILLDFHDECDEKADVMLATGAYIGTNLQTLDLKLY